MPKNAVELLFYCLTAQLEEEVEENMFCSFYSIKLRFKLMDRGIIKFTLTRGYLD